MTLSQAMRTLLRPRVLLSLLLAAALFFLAVSLGNLNQVIGRVLIVPWWIFALVLGCALVYLLVKALQLGMLLKRLDVQTSWRRFALAYSVGEMAVTLPFGIFAQNWVLSGDSDTRFGHSSAATVAVMLAEIFVVLAWLGIVGVPGWAPLQPVAAVLTVTMAGLLFCVRWIEPLVRRLADKCDQHPKLQRAATEFAGLIHGLRELANWRVLAISIVLAAIYLAALMSAFFFMGLGVGLHRLNFFQASTIYAFSLASIFLCGGLAGQVGTVEVLGMSVARAWGFGYTDGLALMLGFRLAWTSAIWLLNVPVLWICRGVLRRDAKS